MANGAERLTISDILKRLTPGDLWTAVIAAASVVGAAFTAGNYVASFYKGSEVATVPCSKVKGWPVGTWYSWAHLGNFDWKPTDKQPYFPQFAPQLTFDSNKSFQLVTDHPSKGSKNNFTGKLNAPLSAGEPVVAEGQDDTGYKSYFNNATVTLDGCMINGQFSDTSGNFGEFHLLFKRDQYYVQP